VGVFLKNVLTNIHILIETSTTIVMQAATYTRITTTYELTPSLRGTFRINYVVFVSLLFLPTNNTMSYDKKCIP